MKPSTWLVVFFASFLIAGQAYGATYYISASTGSDAHTAANAKSKTTPWAHAPGMANCALNCAKYTPVAGDRFIFKGGETWGNASFKWTWSWSGTERSRIYIGVDQTWFTGGGWTRPIFDAESRLMSNGNTFLREEGSYVTVDNIEWKGFVSISGMPFGTNTYINPITSDYVIVEHNYFHGWSSDAGNQHFAVIRGSTNKPTLNPGFTIRYNVFSGKDSPAVLADPDCTRACEANASGFSGSVDSVIGNVFEYVSNACVLIEAREVAYNLAYEFRLATDHVTHGNAFESLRDHESGTLFHDNVIHTIREAFPGIWMIPPTGVTSYVWNNILVNTGVANIVNIGDDTPLFTPCCGTVVFVNNTVEGGPDDNAAYPIVYCPVSANAKCIIKNNHFITSHGTPIFETGRGLTQSNNITQTRAAALAQGYAFAQTPYKFAPVSDGLATFGQGLDLSANCAIMTTLCSDTRYGVVYDDVAHTATLYGRTVNTRPIGAAWSVGAYEFGQGGGVKPTPPSSLRIHE